MTRASHRFLLCLVAVAAALRPPAGSAQMLQLRQVGSNSNRITVSVGEQVNLELWADLSGRQAAGCSVFITIPDDAFQVVDMAPQVVGAQPFVQGPLFRGAAEVHNIRLPETDDAARQFPGQQLEYSVVLGGGSNRIRTGTGVIATFSLICAEPIQNGRLDVNDDPVHETRLVMSDGTTEQRFVTVQGMEITVTGIQLRDIPDVILLPNTGDSLTIGSLNSYVVHTLSPIDSIRWSYEPADPDSLTIEVNPVTKRVTITPEQGWVGRRQITWTATENVARIPGRPPLSASEVSTIVVNNPPRFTVLAGADGVKRDTIRFREDQYPFDPITGNPDAARAFRWVDLDTRVLDPDVINPQLELAFAALTYGGLTAETRVRAQVVGDTHELLVWSRSNFAGVDSLKILVRDGQRGGEDSLRVIVEVTPENDRPVFTLQDRNPTIPMGSTKTYVLADIIEDPDTPLDSLVFSWIHDPAAHFRVDTTHTASGVEINVIAAAGFVGSGRVTFRIEELADPAMVDQIILFFVASERTSWPPDVFPPETKIDLTPGGPSLVEELDDFVEDPDDTEAELTWHVPSDPRRSQVAVDPQTRRLTVTAPLDYVGYERVVLTVTDPDNQSDVLVLRIYSSDGDPVVGGIPDLAMDRGEVNRDIDLDNYYSDSDNLDEEMTWSVLNSFSSTNLQVQVDPVTHGATFTVPQTAAFSTQTVVFRVTDPAGTSATDTMLVTIGSGGGPALFRILPLPTDLQVPVDRWTDLDLDAYVEPHDTTLSWSVSVVTSGNHSIPRVVEGNVLSIFGHSAGTDTLQLTARDTLARAQTALATVRVMGEQEALNLLSIPDIQFIAGQTTSSDTLNVYVQDRETHPDSALSWSLQFVSGSSDVVASVNAADMIFATARDTGTSEWVVVARDTRLAVTGRDTIRIIALPVDSGQQDLKEFPPLFLYIGQQDSSLVLNDYLPDEFLTTSGTTPSVRWTVSGQRITQPIIGTQAPHRLVLRTVGNQRGIDSLRFVADLGGGFRAAGIMEVTVEEPTDETTLDLQLVPNPVYPLYIDLFVLARRELAGTPNVLRGDSTITMRQIEDSLATRGVLIWTSSVRLDPNTTGPVFFRAQASTALGSDVRDTASVVVATAAAGKALALEQGGARLDLPADALPGGTSVVMQAEPAAIDAAAWAKPVASVDGGELDALLLIRTYPAGLRLASPGVLVVGPSASPRDGVYRSDGEGWRYQGAAGAPVSVTTLGQFALMRDEQAPRVQVVRVPSRGGEELLAEVVDRGSGVADEDVALIVDGDPVVVSRAGDLVCWTAPLALAGDHHLQLVVRDRAGNQRAARLDLALGPAGLPVRSELGTNFPNPFNPETTVPFTVVASAAGQTGGLEVELAVYCTSGQLVRQLLHGSMAPGQYRVSWNGRDAGGRLVASGVYLCRLDVAGVVHVRRMTLLK